MCFMPALFPSSAVGFIRAQIGRAAGHAKVAHLHVSVLFCLQGLRAISALRRGPFWRASVCKASASSLPSRTVNVSFMD